jgi:mRNA-degrading endonuclease RelE of RelBE toxin-antitoxin system
VEGFEECFGFEIDEYRLIYRANTGGDVLLFAALGKRKDEQI